MRIVVDYVSFGGTNEGAPQDGYFVMAGGQYERHFGREGVFAEGLVGDATLNNKWYNNTALATKSSFTEFLGGGLDTPLRHSLAFRVEAGVQHTNFALMNSKTPLFPYYRPAGLPENTARLTAGIVWTHQHSAKAEAALVREEEDPAAHLKDSQLVFEGEGSVGHYDILAGTWYSYLHVAGIEYDRHIWGSVAGAQMDYVAEILPLVLLREPQKTDAYGDNLSPGKFKLTPGLAITPVGVKMTWLHRKRVSPFFEIKGGMIFFTRKALSSKASYEDFTLQETGGVEVRMTQRWGLRMGVGDFHFSNGFVVPSDPGIDEMMWSGGLIYQLGKTRWFL